MFPDDISSSSTMLSGMCSYSTSYRHKAGPKHACHKPQCRSKFSASFAQPELHVIVRTQTTRYAVNVEDVQAKRKKQVVASTHIIKLCQNRLGFARQCPTIIVRTPTGAADDTQKFSKGWCDKPVLWFSDAVCVAPLRLGLVLWLVSIAFWLAFLAFWLACIAFSLVKVEGCQAVAVMFTLCIKAGIYSFSTKRQRLIILLALMTNASHLDRHWLMVLQKLLPSLLDTITELLLMNLQMFLITALTADRLADQLVVLL